MLSGILGHAVDDELIIANPVIGILKKLQIDRDKKLQIIPYTLEETYHFLSVCQQKFTEHFPFFLSAVMTGMRLGKVLGLHWSDIDWHKKSIYVQRSYKNKAFSNTKTGKTRYVDMSNKLSEVLFELYSIRQEEACLLGKSKIIEVIFHKGGEPRAQNSIRNIFNRILDKAKLRKIRFHDIRHTYASLLLSYGVSPVYVKEQLGHSKL